MYPWAVSVNQLFRWVHCFFPAYQRDTLWPAWLPFIFCFWPGIPAYFFHLARSFFDFLLYIAQGIPFHISPSGFHQTVQPCKSDFPFLLAQSLTLSKMMDFVYSAYDWGTLTHLNGLILPKNGFNFAWNFISVILNCLWVVATLPFLFHTAFILPLDYWFPRIPAYLTSKTWILFLPHASRKSKDIYI